MSGQAISAASLGSRPVVLFACGNPDRGDDAVAMAAVARLAPEILALASISTMEAMELEALVELPTHVTALIVDAVVGPAPGSIIDVDIADLEQLGGRVAPGSTHQLPLDRLVGLAGILRGAPIEGRFVGVGVADVSVGAPLSPAVMANLPVLCRVIESAVRELRGAA